MRGEIVTPRLRIRDWTSYDLVALAAIFAKPEIWRYPFGRGFSVEETEMYLTRKIASQDSATSSPSAVEERGSGRLIGYISLGPPWWLPEAMPSVEIGWRLDTPCWGQGLATEGARALLAYGFRDMALDEILSIYEPDNTASGRVMQKLGMRFDRETIHPYFHRILHVYGLSRAEWERSEAQ